MFSSRIILQYLLLIAYAENIATMDLIKEVKQKIKF